MPQQLVRRLYASSATGLLDDDLCDDIGVRLLDRCKDMLVAERAHSGAATCPRCGVEVPHGRNPDEQLACACNWRLTWGEYWGTYRRQQLLPGAAEPFIREFVRDFGVVRTTSARMLAIDRLLHQWHWAAGLHRPSRLSQ